MLWLIQRDFLQGKTVSAMVADALAQQPNPHGDGDIQQVHLGGLPHCCFLIPETAPTYVEASWTLQMQLAAANLSESYTYTVGQQSSLTAMGPKRPQRRTPIWAQVNRIRQSLALIARNSSAFGLVQPHLERTKLCQLGDEALEPKYVRQRAALQQLVASLAHPKVGLKGSSLLTRE